jgi:hypothetical protein
MENILTLGSKLWNFSKPKMFIINLLVDIRITHSLKLFS